MPLRTLEDTTRPGSSLGPAEATYVKRALQLGGIYRAEPGFRMVLEENPLVQAGHRRMCPQEIEAQVSRSGEDGLV